MDVYELEVKNLPKEGGNERLKSQFMNLSRRLDEASNENKELKKQISELESKLAEKEESLPFSSDEYEKDRIEKLEKRIAQIEKTLDEQREAEIKRLRAETDLMKSQMTQSEFLAGILGY